MCIRIRDNPNPEGYVEEMRHLSVSILGQEIEIPT
jgi:hypothetical protein